MTAAMTPTLGRVLDRPAMTRAGTFDLGWTHAIPGGWGTRAKPSVNGLAAGDINGERRKP